MKKYIIDKYIDFLILLEDIIDGMETIINNHRKRLDEKYWEKYLK